MQISCQLILFMNTSGEKNENKEIFNVDLNTCHGSVSDSLGRC